MDALIARARLTLREQGPVAAGVKTIRYPLKPFFVSGALRALQVGRRSVLSLEDLFHFVRDFNYRGITIPSWQKEPEIIGLLRILEQQQPKRLAEIGTATGGTLFMLTQVAAPDATIVAVDLPGGRFGGESVAPGGRYPRWRARLYEGFARESQTVHVVRDNSHDLTTVAAVRDRVGRELDFLFVDGDHSYEGVRRDFELYSPFVREGGLVAFHDIVPSGPGKHGDPGGVPIFWREVRERHTVEAEFVEDWQWGSCGIGVLRL